MHFKFKNFKYFLGCLKFLIFFWVNVRCWARADIQEKMRVPPWAPIQALIIYRHLFNGFVVNVITLYSGAQWLSGRVLDSRMRGLWVEHHRRHWIVVLEQDTFILA